MITGVDVSHWEGNIYWPSVRQAGYVFSFCKATESTTLTDRTFYTNTAGARNAGMLTGAYHFYRLSASPRAQAEYFLSRAQLAPIDLPLVLDFEEQTTMSQTAVAAALKTFLDVVEQATRRKPIIYTSAYYWNTFVGNPIWARQYPLWVANYTLSPVPLLPRAWSVWTFWQHTDRGVVPGIPSGVDLNRFPLPLESLLRLAGRRTDAPKTPIPQSVTIQPQAAATRAADGQTQADPAELAALEERASILEQELAEVRAQIEARRANP
jgi:lysozyme